MSRSQPGHRHLDAVDAQMRLLDQWSNPRLALGEAAAWHENSAMEDEMLAQGGFKVTYDEDPGAGADRNMVMAKTIYMALNRASTYWVTSDMVSLIEHASRDLPDEPLHPMDMPSQSGFAFLERPYYITDGNGDLCNVKAIMWTPSYMHLDLRDPDGNPTIGVARTIQVVYFSSVSDVEQDDQFQRATEKYGFNLGERVFGKDGLVLLHISAWFWKDADDDGKPRIQVRTGKLGDPYDWLPGEYEEYPTDDPTLRLHYEVDAQSPFLIGLWRIATQEIAVVANRHLDRPSKRRIARSKHQPQWGDVRTIDLRRNVYPEGSFPQGEGERKYDHRWVVSGHWRKQWYPSEGRHKWRYIAAYVKGPEDAPLVMKEDVRRVVR